MDEYSVKHVQGRFHTSAAHFARGHSASLLPVSLFQDLSYFFDTSATDLGFCFRFL